MSDAAHTPTSDAPEHAPPTVYWRPGCGFCSGLLRDLERRGVEVETVDIWQDPDGAAFVRSVARGNETVPTVVVGELALINPTGREVLRALAEHDPSRLPADLDPRELEGGHLARWMTRVLGG